MSNKALQLSNKELELTQRIQLHFPRGVLSPEVLNFFNSCPVEVLQQAILAGFSKKPQSQILRQLYADDVIMVDGREMAVYELAENAEFVDMYGFFGVSLEQLWMPVAQREKFCKEHHDKIRGDDHATFFLHKKDEAKPATSDNLEVARVSVDSDGLGVYVYRFECDYLWRAGDHRRLVVPLQSV